MPCENPDARIVAFIEQHHVMALATCVANDPWAANAFYAYDAETICFLILSSHDTRHGRFLGRNADVAGCIAAQPRLLSEVRGLQFAGSARLLQDSEAEAANAVYYARFPDARRLRAPIWRIRPHLLKLTDNSLGFGTKLLWRSQAE